MDLQTKLRKAVRDINDFPVKGIIFRDITPVLQDISLVNEIIECFAQRAEEEKIDKIVGIEARGFLIGVPLAIKLNIPFAPIRKKGKLPSKKVEAAYNLEYGSAIVEIHEDAIKKGERILIIDDLLATGGTVNAANELIGKLEGVAVGAFFLIELEGMHGRDSIKNKDLDVFSIIKY
ncbi:MAG: adenine phosphoribosyltransferase [Elusimicrobiota bacterium]|jgi:adenine phosphoribosyltransferase|nr:adenine phosphoribosyltransferase [Elusimicrobiota bacterium]